MTEPTLNDILQQYHSKFDDSKVRELLEELEQMMYERASFFHNDNLDLDEDSKLFEEIDDYWSGFDELAYGSESHTEIIDKLRDDVEGLETCNSCSRMGIVKPKLMSGMTERMYIVKLCENCISKKNLIMESKKEVRQETPIPSDLSKQEKEIMIKYQTAQHNLASVKGNQK